MFSESEIYFDSEDIDFDYEKSSEFSDFAKDMIKENGKKCGEISFVFCSDDYLYEMNKKHLNHDYLTDVITFDYCEKKIVSGDIFISIDRIKDNAQTYEVSFENELNRIMIHGILHLLKFDDKTEKDKELMTQKEDYYLSKYV